MDPKRKSQRYNRRLQNTPGARILDDSLDQILMALALPPDFVGPDDYREYNQNLDFSDKRDLANDRAYKAKVLKTAKSYGPPNSIDRKLAEHAVHLEGLRGLMDNPQQPPAVRKAMEEVLKSPKTKGVPKELIKQLAAARRAKGLLPLLALSLIVGGAGMAFSRKNEA